MNAQEDEWDEVLKGVDAALRRAALKAKEEAERLGTPYVVAEIKNNVELQKVMNEVNQ